MSQYFVGRTTRVYSSNTLLINLLLCFYYVDQYFSILASFTFVNFNSENPQPAMKAEEFWELKPTNLKVAKVEKH